MRNMRTGIWIALLIALPSIALATTHINKTVGSLQSTYSGGDCFYFTLQGVTQADPVAPGSPWFTIPRSQYGSKDAYAMLLAARLSGTLVTVNTNGTTACGYPIATEVRMD